MGYIFKLGAVYIFDRYGVINNGFFAKKKGEEEDEEVAVQVEAKSFLVVSFFSLVMYVLVVLFCIHYCNGSCLLAICK